MQRSVAVTPLLDWLVHNSLPNEDRAKLGNVHTGIKVGIRGKATGNTMEETLRTVGFADDPATTTTLASVGRVDEDNPLTQTLSLVVEELAELEIRPVAPRAIKSLALASFPHVFEFFQCENRVASFSELLAEPVVVVSHESSLPSSQTLQFTFGGLGATCLQPFSQVSKPTLNTTYTVSFKLPSITADGEILQSKVHTENGNFVGWFWCVCFNNYVDPDVFVSVDADITSLDGPANISLEVIWDVDVESFTPADECELKHPRFEESLGGSQVKANPTQRLFESVLPLTIPLQHLNGVVAGALNQCTGKLRELQADRVIQRLMQCFFGVGVVFQGVVDVLVGDSIVCFDCLKKCLIERYGQFHTTLHRLLCDCVFKNGGYCRFIHPTSWVVFSPNNL